MRALLAVALLGLGACTADPAADQAAGPAIAEAAAADDSAQLLAAGCRGCHGDAGNAMPGWQGLSAGAIETALRAWRDGRRDGTVMPRIAAGYSDAEISALARALGAP